MKDKEEKHTALQMQLKAVLLIVHKLLNQSLCPHQYLSIHCVHEEEIQQDKCQ